MEREIKQINEHILKLQGKASLPKALEISKNYDIIIKGSVSHTALKDNEDGSYDAIYSFNPVLVEVITETGDKILARDTRSDSKLWKSLLWMKWKEAKTDLNDEAFYHLVNNWLTRSTTLYDKD